MAAHRVKSEGERPKPEPGGRNQAALEITDHYARSCNTIHFRDQSSRRIFSEMVQHLGSENDVDALVAEWKRERITAKDMRVARAMDRKPGQLRC